MSVRVLPAALVYQYLITVREKIFDKKERLLHHAVLHARVGVLMLFDRYLFVYMYYRLHA